MRRDARSSARVNRGHHARHREAVDVAPETLDLGRLAQQLAIEAGDALRRRSAQAAGKREGSGRHGGHGRPRQRCRKRHRCVLGDDGHGIKLEVVGVELADCRLRVIHAMPMRPGYEPLYQEAHKWRQ